MCASGSEPPVSGVGLTGWLGGESARCRSVGLVTVDLVGPAIGSDRLPGSELLVDAPAASRDWFVAPSARRACPPNPGEPADPPLTREAESGGRRGPGPPVVGLGAFPADVADGLAAGEAVADWEGTTVWVLLLAEGEAPAVWVGLGLATVVCCGLELPLPVVVGEDEGLAVAVLGVSAEATAAGDAWLWAGVAAACPSSAAAAL